MALTKAASTPGGRFVHEMEEHLDIQEHIDRPDDLDKLARGIDEHNVISARRQVPHIHVLLAFDNHQSTILVHFIFGRIEQFSDGEM